MKRNKYWEKFKETGEIKYYLEYKKQARKG